MVNTNDTRSSIMFGKLGNQTVQMKRPVNSQLMLVNTIEYFLIRIHLVLSSGFLDTLKFRIYFTVNCQMISGILAAIKMQKEIWNNLNRERI